MCHPDDIIGDDEKMELSETGKELKELLKGIYDNDDYITEVMNNAPEKKWHLIIDYINYEKKHDIQTKAEVIKKLSSALKRKYANEMIVQAEILTGFGSKTLVVTLQNGSRLVGKSLGITYDEDENEMAEEELAFECYDLKGLLFLKEFEIKYVELYLE